MKLRLGIILILSNTLAGCNLFSAVDTPKNDEQILSKARACFDEGDFACASKYYAKLSSNSADEGNSEEAFENLSENGVTIGVFISAVLDGGSNGGVLITKIADALTPVANQTTRLGIFHAYQKAALISDQRTRGLIRFVTATSLVAELLAENAGTSGTLAQKDLVANPAACVASQPFYNDSGCNSPPGKKLVTGTAIPSLSLAADSDLTGPSGNPTLYMVQGGINEIETAVSEMSATAGAASSASDFALKLISIALVPGTDSPLYRGNLIQYNVGE